MKKTSALKKILFVGILTLLLGNFDVYAEEKLITIPEGRTKDTLEVGDEICINGETTECFNFYGYDENNIKMLAKYNLKVGNIFDGYGTPIGRYSSDDDGYGLQSSEAKAYVSGDQNRYGTVAFSYTNYWIDYWTNGNGYSVKEKYNIVGGFPAEVYDTDYKTEPDFSSNGFETSGYSIAYYVEEYKNKLEDYGVSINDARLLTYAEATDEAIGCTKARKRCSTDGFIGNTSFWFGFALGSDDSVMRLLSLWNEFSDYNYSYDDTFGVRPVIVINKDETDKVIQSSTDNDANNNSQNDANNDEIITDIPNTGFGSNFVVIYLLGFTFIGLGSLVVYNAIEKRKREN